MILFKKKERGRKKRETLINNSPPTFTSQRHSYNIRTCIHVFFFKKREGEKKRETLINNYPPLLRHIDIHITFEQLYENSNLFNSLFINKSSFRRNNSTKPAPRR